MFNECLEHKCENSVVIGQLRREVENLMKTTNAKLLLQDGKIAELCVYIKDNLGESLSKMLDAMLTTGQLQSIISQVVSGSLASALYFDPIKHEKHIQIDVVRNEEMKTSYVVTKVSKDLKPYVNFTNGTNSNPYTNNKNVVDYMKTVNKPVGINGGLKGVTVKDGVSHIESNVVGDEGFFILAIDVNGRLKAFPRTATGTEIVNAGYRDAINIWSPIVEDNVFFDERALDSTHEDYDYIFNQKHPRQILGVLENGDYVIITTDGRMVDEDGLTFAQMKQVVLELGCVSAYNLDGGKSTQTVVGKKLITRSLSESRTIGTVITFEGEKYECRCNC